MTDYLMCRYDEAHGQSIFLPRGAQARNKYAQAVGCFFSVLNGGIYEDGLRHYSTDTVDIAALALELGKAINIILFRTVPPVPCMGKLTKLGPCLDFFVKSFMHEIHQDVERTAFKELSLQLAKKGTPPPLAQVTDDDDGDAMVNPAPETVEASWNKVAGTRLLRLERVVHCSTERVLIICLAVVTEPSRFLTHYFMSLSTDCEIMARGHPCSTSYGIQCLPWCECISISRHCCLGHGDVLSLSLPMRVVEQWLNGVINFHTTLHSSDA